MACSPDRSIDVLGVTDSHTRSARGRARDVAMVRVQVHTELAETLQAGQNVEGRGRIQA